MMSAKAKKKNRRPFGATAPPFIDYLKDILRRYPDGGQILKELIQNADDAGATEVIFVHDNRSYGTDDLWAEGLAKFQGPALYAYNNAQFTDEDWEGIQSVARSVKRDDPNKVGRFGLGFNSVYHITDMTCIFSAGHLGMLDPQEKIFDDKNAGCQWSLDDEDDQQALTEMQDQFQPFRDIVALISGQEWTRIIQEDQNFNGTLFRFPLRTEKSQISDNLYSYERVVDLFGSFIVDADLSLLFLKSVSSVSLIHVDAEGSVSTQLEVKSTASQDVKLESFKDATEGYTTMKSITLKSDELKETKWLVTSCTLKEGHMDKLDYLAERLKFVPRVDLAFPCNDNVDCSKSRLCCFLPLPNNDSNKTGLPVYVNAYFGLTDNRREIKWLEEDQMNDEHAIWNELLIKEVLPEAFLTIFQDAIRLFQDYVLPVNSIYSLWPDLSQVQHKEKWHAVALDVLTQLFDQNIAVLSLAKDERQFITLSEAVFPCNGPTPSDTLAAIKRVLVSRDENLVTLSDSVTRALKAAYPGFSSLTHVTPAFLRDILHSTGVEDISDLDRRILLEYVLSDGQYAKLHGLQLLPVSDGSFKSFTNREEDTVLIDSKEFPRTLLPFCQSLFIPDSLSPECVYHLRQLAEQSKNIYNIQFVQYLHLRVLRYTRSHLPEEWNKTENSLVIWEVNSDRHPPLNWLQEFWRFLNSHFMELNCLTGLPLIPVNTVSRSQPVTLAKIQSSPTLIFEKSKQVALPDNIIQMINKVGGTVVKENNWLKHEDLDSYVLSPSPQHVLQVFVNLQSQQVVKDLMTVPKKALEELKEYFSKIDALSSCEKEFLLQLPLFQTMAGEYTNAQSKQAVLLISGLTIPVDLPLPDTVVKCANEADRRLLQLLKITLLDTAQAVNFLMDNVENRAGGKTDTEKIMTWILDHGNILFYQNPNLKRRCTHLSFIEINGKLKKTSCLYDPRVNSFKVLFEDDYFPPAVYTKTQQMLASLIDLGLIHKEVDMSPEHLLHAATIVEKLTSCNNQKARQKAQALLKILDSTDLLEDFTHDQTEQLKRLKWVPVTNPKDKQKISVQNGFSCPEEMRHSMYEDIVGYVMPMEGMLGENICSKLGLKQPPPPGKVVTNLSVLISKAKELDSPDTNVDLKKKLRSIYGHMQKSIHEYTTIISKDTRWLWNRNQFMAPRELVLNFPDNLDLSSQIGKVPDEFLPYKRLFQEFGLREELTDEEIIELLYRIKQTIEGREAAVATSSEVKVSIDILNWIWREKKEVSDDVPVPVILQHGQYTLKPKSAAVFCDLSKNCLKELECSQEEMYVVYEEMPIATAEWLDIQLLSTCILDPKSVGIEQCGQTEPITTRIKNILKEYDEESDIFKEIIQNAEDAGAQTCKFLLDFRVHKDDPESLIDPNMKLCQGPCVWAYNNEQFSPDDWKNIVKVGSASKENMVEKIGMFGLGFNTVYHVTDIPSILSGSTLLILDPNITHLKKRIKHKSNPGIKLELSRQSLFQWFPGQFAPYEGVFNCTFSGQTPKHYPGTLIKLPFRTKEESLSSEISSKVYYNQDILAFQKHFTKDSPLHLIFLKNVSTVALQTASSLSSTPLTDGDITDIFTVSKTTLCRMNIPEEGCALMSHVENMLMQLDRKYKDVIDCSNVNIVEITCQQSGETQVQCWLLSSCFGTKESLKLAMGKNKNVAFSLPAGGVAVPLQCNHETKTFEASQTNLAGKAFCFLPLSIDTGLPFNVNGTFAVTSNRKALWESGVKHEWNKSLLQDPIVSAIITALLALKNMSQNKQLDRYCYHTFWPHREHVSENFRPLVDAFYSTISQTGSAPKLFSDGDHWFSLENTLIFHESIEEDQNIFPLVLQVCQKHVKSSHAVSLPSGIRNSFKQAGLEKALQQKTWNWERFYKEAVFPNLAQIDPEWRDTLMLHAIHLNTEEIDSLLVAYPCIPTTSGQLQYIHNLVNPNGKVACLFEQEEGRTLGGTINDFSSFENVLRLQRLGMASDMLSLEDIAKKAEAVNTIWLNDKNKAYEHIKCLLDLLKHYLDNEDSPFWEALRAIPFVPAFSPGDTTMKREVMLQRPGDVFADRCALLVNMTKPVLQLSNLKLHSSDPVLQMLGVNDNPGPEVVLQQLKEAQAQCQSLDSSVLHKMASECYKFLDHHLCDSDGDMRNVILQSAKSCAFVLVDDKFVNINCVAETARFEARPYLYALPHQFTHFRTLWEMVGVEREFSICQYMEAVRSINSKHRNRPLPVSDLSICLTILNRGIYETGKRLENCLVPNRKGILQPAHTMFYNDSPWMPVQKGVTFCHENISRVMAIHLGIKTTRHHTLMSNTVENMSPFAFQFEQQEDLTVRIRNIISAYPAKKDILKELIQNADDAGATEIHFVWDKRQHSNVKTFGEKWNALQGPALCVFNNRVFSDADLKGIQQLGEGGKHNSPGKTGKYGLGFNSVYHLTDCPAILTGDELLCISDPNQEYIESTSDISPAGIGYNLVDAFKEMYMDVYRSFLPDMFSLSEGTMFRLPLRTVAMANSSKISHESVTEQDMKELCSALSEEPEGLILFLKSISKIHVYEVDKSGDVQMIYAVEKCQTKSSIQKKEAFDECKQHALIAHTPVDQKVVYGTVISTSQKRTSKWIVAERFVRSTDGEQKMATDKLAQATVAVRFKNEPISSTHFKGEAFCSLPLPGHTGLPVHVNANFEVDSSRRNLWKEDTHSQKMKWNEYLKQKVIAPLYADLLDHLHSIFKIKQNYKTKIEQILNESYLCFFPIVSKDVNPDWHEMVHEVYRSIKERSLDVIPVFKPQTATQAAGKLSSPIKVYYFDWCSITETDPTQIPYLPREINEQINSILEDVGMRLVPLSMQKVWSSFHFAGIELDYVTPSTVQTFLRAKPLNDPSQTEKQLPLPVSQTLIKDGKRCAKLLGFCLKDLEAVEEKDIKGDPSIIHGLPLLLTKDKVLRAFNLNSPKVASLYEQVFIGHEHQFADYETNRMCISTLTKFGFVKMLTILSAAEYLKPLIEHFLQTCEADPNKKLYIPSENMLVWLKYLWRFIISQLTSSKCSRNDLTLGAVKQLYSECCILPVICPQNKQKYLQMMRDMPSVILFCSDMDVSKSMFRLGFMKLNTSFFKDMDRELYSHFSSELLDVTNSSSVLDQLYNKNILEFSQLSASELSELQSFLNSGVSKAKDKQDYQRKFKSLPLFETINHERVRIDGSKHVYVLSMTEMTRFPNLFRLPETSAIFLKNSFENMQLSQTLNIQTLSDLDYFVQFLVPVVHKLTECQTLDCLKLLLSLQHYYDFPKSRGQIVSTFKNVRLIRSSLGQLQLASYFFDDGVELFKVMLPKERFVPKTFWDEITENNPCRLCNYHPAFTSENTAVSISGSLIEGEKRDEELIWSSMAIIHVPVYKSKAIQQMLSCAGAYENPLSENVAKNLQNICLSPCQNEKTIQIRARVFQSCYAFLQMTPFKSQWLTGLPVVLVEKNKKLVRIEDVCFSLHYDNDFRPYLYKIPPELAIYKDFFTKIGVKNEPSAVQFCNVLAAVHSETNNKPNLQANQLKTVKRAVQQLFNLVKQQKECLVDIKVLYLPGVNEKLMESHKLYYNDTLFEASRLEQALPEKFVLLEKLSNCHLKKDIYVHHKLIKLLPQRLQPQMLSQITEEKVVETQMELCERNCTFSGFFEEHLSSSVFQHGLICLIRAESEGKITQEKAVEMCNNIFGRIQIVCCQSLQTELWLGKQQLPSTASETEVYVNKGQQHCIFYLLHNDMDPVGIFQVCQTLAMEINSLLGNILESNSLMACSSLIMCDNLERVRKILAKHKIPDSVEVERLHFSPPAPGTKIPEEWHDALDMSILNNFEEGEYVGYDSNGKYIYAIIVEELPRNTGQLTQRYKIDIGEEEPIEVGFLDLYQFKRETQPTPSSSLELQLVEGATPHFSQQNTRSSCTSVEEAKKEIDKSLNEVWTLPTEERKKAIKRLYLRWHPDKNLDIPLIATEAIKYLLNRIDELTKGKCRSSGSSSSSSSYSRGHTNFRDFFHQWDEEARHHRTSRERFHTGRHSYNFWTFNNNIPRPDKEEAKRWCKQAQCDLNAAHNDTEKGTTEWCLFKVHQAVEKALIAASYRNNGKHPKSSIISTMALKVSYYSPSLRSLPQLVTYVQALGVDPKTTQYPDCHPFPHIPNGQFQEANERQALDKASEILTQVEAYVNH
uniref:HEPN domain-containing protein n=1 Tax=Periophthalmus magnuspinnatus TaxID=409849 RepID=A0A3B3Z6N1_9GOBI